MLIVLSQNCSDRNPLSLRTWQQLLQFFYKGLLLTALSRFRTPVCWKQKTICNEGLLELECRVNFLLTESLRKRRFWATDENRKWDVFLHILFPHYRLSSVETISLKMWEKSLSWHRVAWKFFFVNFPAIRENYFPWKKRSAKIYSISSYYCISINWLQTISQHSSLQLKQNEQCL